MGFYHDYFFVIFFRNYSVNNNYFFVFIFFRNYSVTHNYFFVFVFFRNYSVNHNYFFVIFFWGYSVNHVNLFHILFYYHNRFLRQDLNYILGGFVVFHLIVIFVVLVKVTTFLLEYFRGLYLPCLDGEPARQEHRLLNGARFLRLFCAGEFDGGDHVVRSHVLQDERRVEEQRQQRGQHDRQDPYVEPQHLSL